MSNTEAAELIRLRKQALLIRDASRIYFDGKDKKDPNIAKERYYAAADLRYFHNKWLSAKQ